MRVKIVWKERKNTLLAYIIKAILIKAAASCIRMWDWLEIPLSLFLWFSIISCQWFSWFSNIYNILLFKVWLYQVDSRFVSAIWRVSKNIMQISHYINKVWRWIIFAVNNTEGQTFREQAAGGMRISSHLSLSS